MMPSITLLGIGACSPDAQWRETLPFAIGDIDRGAIPLPLRRRTSQATKMAFSAAQEACARARRSPQELPAVFACAAGEIQVTDSLCIELAKPNGRISPTDFHNSVHNTAVGYWSIVHRCTRAACAIAAGHETFAMALLEAWSLLATQSGEVLLICYDETWPEYLCSPMGAPPFACALVLAAGDPLPGGIAEIARPHVGATEPLPPILAEPITRMPAAAAMPLLAAVTAGGAEREVPLSALSPGWVVTVKPL